MKTQTLKMKYNAKKDINMFKNKILLLTGGTGSFGNAVLQRFLDSDLSEIRVLSRDEKKQDDMRKKFKNDKLKFFLGDVRDIRSIETAFENVDYIFHAAALKQVPSCEFFPIEAVKTNVLGTENVLDCAIKNKVKKVVCLSTDKAVYPINAMGTSKAMMEKVIVAKSRTSKDTSITITRYGNVMASRGSVIPLFVDQITNNKPITITNPKMTRFMMTLEDAVDLVIYAFKNSNSGDIFIQKSPAATIDTLVKALLKTMNIKDYKTEVLGTRHGEKQYEVLLTKEEAMKALDEGDYYRVPPDLRDLNYEKFISKGQQDVHEFQEYNSDNTHRLDVDGTIELLKKLKFFKGESNVCEES